MLRALIVEELSFSQKVIRSGHEVVPRFRMLTSDGEISIVVPMPDDTAARLERLKIVHGIMVLKMASSFIHASELVEPDAVAAVAVTFEAATGALQRIQRAPLSFGAPEWFGAEGIGDELLELLPKLGEELNEAETEFVARALRGGVEGIRWVRGRVTH